MTQLSVPTSSSSFPPAGRKWMTWAAAPLLAALFVGGYWLATRGGGRSSAGRADAGLFHAVEAADLEIKISKDGELQAIDNIDITSRVEGTTTIQTLVKEGTSVKKGDTLATLDSSAIRQKIEDTTLELQRAEADLTTATELRDIQQSQNGANLQAAEVDLTLAKLDLQAYVDGTYPQQVNNARITLKMAEITLKNADDDLEQTRSLAAKGFVTAADVKKGELAVTVAQQALDQATVALAVLTKYTHESDLATKRNALAQAEQKLARTKKENASNLSQRVADANAKAGALSLLKRRMQRLDEQLAACTINAPADGIVIYATSNDRNAQSPIQEGAQVRERQALFRLPDTARMKAVVRISEGAINKLRTGMRASVQIAGFKEPFGATLTKISPLVDNSQRWWNPDLKEYPVDLELDQTPAGLKPGVTAAAQVYIDRIEQATAVPMAAVYAAGIDSYVFVRRGATTDAAPQKVTLGPATETHVQVTGGLAPGAQVLLLQAGQGRALLEQAGIKPRPAPTSQPGGDGRRRPRPANPTAAANGLPPV
ncbi:MAG TPA: HlyD family efflux transporter periplasmic adaptor subunit [Tepidisphaeraceae bacterium]|nr:HlyD family efflux transporter periplasmic adaptor subunit [Tepidisphaeraceae bacterium]